MTNKVSRAEKKQESLRKILNIASIKLREEGLSGAAIAPVMKEAGLTHGAFYSHFANKDELAQAAFKHALTQSQPSWFERAKDKQRSWHDRLRLLARSYLTQSHRDDRANGCAISALASHVPKSSEAFKATYEASVKETLELICENDEQNYDEAIRFLALCVGGLSLARAIKDPALSKRILKVTENAAGHR